MLSGFLWEQPQARIVPQWILKVWSGRAWNGFIWPRIWSVVGFCQHRTEPSGSIKRQGIVLRNWAHVSFQKNESTPWPFCYTFLSQWLLQFAVWKLSTSTRGSHPLVQYEYTLNWINVWLLPTWSNRVLPSLFETTHTMRSPSNQCRIWLMRKGNTQNAQSNTHSSL